MADSSKWRYHLYGKTANDGMIFKLAKFESEDHANLFGEALVAKLDNYSNKIYESYFVVDKERE